MFLLVPGFEVDPAEWNSMMDHIDLDDPSQAEMAGHITGKFAMTPSDGNAGNDPSNATEDTNTTSQIFPRTSSEQNEYDRQMLEVLHAL